MSYVNAEKLIKELNTALTLIDQDPSPEGTTSNIIDRCGRSVFMLLISVVENTKEPVVNEEVKDLKEKLLRLQIEVARLYREKRLKNGNSP